MLGELITIIIYLSARPSRDQSLGPVALFSTLAATFYFLFIDLQTGVVLASQAVAAFVQGAGIALQIWAKLSLGRSFGLLPANKGIVTRGPYHFIRHPIYLGYFIAHCGFLLSSWSTQNLAIFTLLYFFQFIRIQREEALLQKDTAYQAYAEKTRYKVFPGIY